MHLSLSIHGSGGGSRTAKTAGAARVRRVVKKKATQRSRRARPTPSNTRTAKVSKKVTKKKVTKKKASKKRAASR